MLATKEFTELLGSEGMRDLSIKRAGGIINTINIPREFASSGAVLTNLAYNGAEGTAEVYEGGLILALTSKVGVHGDSTIEITFINRNMAIVSVVDGTIFMTNVKNVPFGYDADSNVTTKATKVLWKSVSEFYDYIEERLMYKFNVDKREVVDYIYNATFTLELNYTEYPPSKAKQSNCYYDYRCKFADMSADISAGQFDFITFEKEAEEREYNPYSRSQYNKWSSKKKKDDEEEQYYIESDEEAYARQEARYEAECDDAEEDNYVIEDDDELEDDDWDDNEWGADDSDGYRDEDD